MEPFFWPDPPSSKVEEEKSDREDDIVARIHVRLGPEMGELREDDSKKKKSGFCRGELLLGEKEAEVRMWLAHSTSVRLTHVVVAPKYIELYLGAAPPLTPKKRDFFFPSTPKGRSVPPPPPATVKPIFRAELPEEMAMFLNVEAAVVSYRRLTPFTQLFTLSAQIPLVPAMPLNPPVCLQPHAPFVVSVLPVSSLVSLLDTYRSAGPQGPGRPDSSLLDAAFFPLDHPFQRIMDEVHAWVQLANIYHPKRKRMGTVLTDVNGNKYCIYAQQIDQAVAVIFSVVALWQSFDACLTALDETPTPAVIYEKLPPRCFLWPDRPEAGYSGPYFKDVMWAECAPPGEPIWGLVASQVQPDIFIRLLLALLLDVSVLVLSNDPWLLLQTLEAMRALRLPPCPLECYFPLIDPESAMERTSSPTAVVLGCLSEPRFEDLDTLLQEVSTCVLVIDLQQPISKQRDEKLLSAFESSPVFRVTHTDIALALRPLNFVLNPKKYGLMTTLYNNLHQACVAAQNPLSSGLALVKDAFGNILDDVLSFSPWWTCATDTVEIADKLDLSSLPNYLDSSFAITHAFAQWKSFSKRYLGNAPICNVRPALIRARSLMPAPGQGPHPPSARAQKRNIKSESPGGTPEEVVPPHQLLVGEQGVYLKFNNEGFTRTSHRMTLEQSSQLKISHLSIESLPKLTGEPECRMIIGNPQEANGRTPRGSHTRVDSDSSITLSIPTARVPQPPRVRVFRSENGEITADAERNSNTSVITHSDLVGGVGNTCVIIGNVLAEESERQQSPRRQSEAGSSGINSKNVNNQDEIIDEFTSSFLSPESDDSNRSARGSCSGEGSSRRRSRGASGSGKSSDPETHDPHELPVAIRSRSETQWNVPSLTAPRSSLPDIRLKPPECEGKLPPPPPPTVPTTVKQESGLFASLRRSPKSGIDIAIRPVAPLQRGMNSSRSPGQWLEDARSDAVTGLDLAVPLKYAGLLLRAIEADTINQREGSKKRIQKASETRLLRALELSRSGSNSPVPEEKKPQRAGRGQPRILDESDRTPRRGNFKTPSPNSRRPLNGPGTKGSSGFKTPAAIAEDGSLDKRSSDEEGHSRNANGRLDEDHVVNNLWSNLDALRVGIDGGSQILIPKFKACEVIFEEEIASGLEGSVVFRGRLSSGKAIAIKVSKAHAVGEEENGFDTLSEAYHLLSLKARKPEIGVVACLGVAAVRPPHFQMVMPCLILELCETNLVQLVKKVDTFWSSLIVRVGLCIQLAQTLVDLHEYGVIHRDLRPEHVLMTEHKTFVISGFKLAESIASPRFVPLRTPVYYRAPELECNGYLDSAPQPADVFALGKILSVIVSQQLPATDQTDVISCKVLSKPLHTLIESCTKPFGLFHSKRYDAKQVLVELLEIERELVEQEVKIAGLNTNNDPVLFVQGMLRAMRLNQNLRLCERACHILTNVQLTNTSAPAILTVLTKEEPRTVNGCDEIKLFSDSLYLAWNVLFALFAASIDNGRKLFESGCVDLACALLAYGPKIECRARESHSNRFLKLHAQFAAKACSQIDKLVANSAQHAMLLHGGCTQVLLVALRLFSRCSDVQQPAFSALGELSTEPDARAILLQHLDMFIAIMKLHVPVAYIQEHACKVLRSLASSENLTRMVKAGCFEVLLIVMRTHPTVAAIQAHACGVIKELAFVAEHRTLLLGKGCIDLVLQAMKTHQRSASVQFFGSGALWSLASHPETKKKLFNIATVDLLLTALETHPGDCTVQQNAIGALGKLAPAASGRIRSDSDNWDNGSPKSTGSRPATPSSPRRMARKEPILRPSPLVREESTPIIAIRGLDLFLAALQNHNANFGVVKTLCGAIKTWGRIPGNKTYLKQMNCEELLQRALRSNEPLRSEIVGALAVLV